MPLKQDQWELEKGFNKTIKELKKEGFQNVYLSTLLKLSWSFAVWDLLRAFFNRGKHAVTMWWTLVQWWLATIFSHVLLFSVMAAAPDGGFHSNYAVGFFLETRFNCVEPGQRPPYWSTQVTCLRNAGEEGQGGGKAWGPANLASQQTCHGHLKEEGQHQVGHGPTAFTDRTRNRSGWGWASQRGGTALGLGGAWPYRFYSGITSGINNSTNEGRRRMVQPGVEAGQQEEHSEIPSLLLSTTAIIISHISISIINILINNDFNQRNFLVK